ncbi:MAG: hypothetical protein PHC89_01295 [Candidatus Pacebacteria bacterium]|nr:hypothetical protein [Candidatus Paceibacterota bacterium]
MNTGGYSNGKDVFGFSERVLELFPEEIWKKDGKLSFPEGKRAYHQKELDFFEKIIKEKFEQCKASSDFIKDEEKRSVENGRGRKPYEDDLSVSVLNAAVLPKVTGYIIDLKNALDRIKSGSYGKNRFGELIHPYRLCAVPTTTKNVWEKQG